MIKMKTSHLQTKILNLSCRDWLSPLNEGLRTWISGPLVTLYTSFYGVWPIRSLVGTVVIAPLMIQDLVRSQSLISLRDFLAGYAIDQAVGPTV